MTERNSPLALKPPLYKASAAKVLCSNKMNPAEPKLDKDSQSKGYLLHMPSSINLVNRPSSMLPCHTALMRSFDRAWLLYLARARRILNALKARATLYHPLSMTFWYIFLFKEVHRCLKAHYITDARSSHIIPSIYQRLNHSNSPHHYADA